MVKLPISNARQNEILQDCLSGKVDSENLIVSGVARTCVATIMSAMYATSPIQFIAGLYVLAMTMTEFSKDYAARMDQNRDVAEKIACREGCCWCCHQVVPISISEAIYIAIQVERLPFREQDRLKRKIKKVAKVSKNNDQRLRKIIPCPFLDTERGLCIIYAYRPMACRSYLATDAEKCKAVWYDQTSDDNSNNVITVLPAELAIVSFLKSYEALGLESSVVELSRALNRIFANGVNTVLQKWLGGKSQFQSSYVELKEAERTPDQVSQIIKMLTEGGVRHG